MPHRDGGYAYIRAIDDIDEHAKSQERQDPPHDDVLHGPFH
jgi:hypothetical protein